MDIKRFLLALFLLFFIIGMDSSLWQKTFGGKDIDEANDIYIDSEGYYIVVGYRDFLAEDGPNVYVLKIKESGDKVWEKIFGGKDFDCANSIIETLDKCYIIVGHTASFGAGSYDFYILKIDRNGNKLWEKIFGGKDVDMAVDVKNTPDGGNIIVGSTASFGSGGFDIYVLKLDKNGKKIWEKVFGGKGDDIGNSIEMTSDGGFVIAGSSTSFSLDNSDMYLLKLDNNGNKIWEKTFGGEDADVARSICAISDGGYIIAGYTRSFDAKGNDVYVIKLDKNYNKIWEKRFGKNEIDEANSIIETSDGGYIIGGYTGDLSNGDVYIIKLNKKGDKIWEKTFGGKKIDIARSIQETSNKDYVVAGFTAPFGAGENDLYILKINKDGNTGRLK
ncbi:MAG: hypothetical protein N2380_06585 [bacterium]|nr:hypothetical protein [bacterium]